MRRPKGVRNTACVTTTTQRGTTCFSGAKRYNPRPAPFSSISFPARGKRYGPRSGGHGATNRTAPSAHTKCAAGGIFPMRETRPRVRCEKILPSRQQKAEGREYRGYFVVPPRFRGQRPPFFRADGAEPGDFGAKVRLIRLLSGCPSRSAPQEPFSKRFPL